MEDPSPPAGLQAPGFDPVAGGRPRVLILGSFPSVLSLTHREYYGNPRNQFWQIIEAHFAIPATLPYPDRIARLTDRGLALWDVIGSCERPGSADSRIREPVPNDIAGFVRAHPAIRLVALKRQHGRPALPPVRGGTGPACRDAALHEPGECNGNVRGEGPGVEGCSGECCAPVSSGSSWGRGRLQVHLAGSADPKTGVFPSAGSYVQPEKRGR
jgi:hypoxanthine-DNA glycosylase